MTIKGPRYGLLETEEMIRILGLAGAATSERVVNGLLEKGEEAFPHLARIATFEEYWYGEEYSGSAPLGAIHILAMVNHYPARLAIISAMIDNSDDEGDWLTEDMPYVLAHTGADAMWMLDGVARNRDLDEVVRETAMRAMVMIARSHPEMKRDTIATIRDAAGGEEDEMTRSGFMECLIDFEDPEQDEYVKDAIRTGFVSAGCMDTRRLERDGPEIPGMTRAEDHRCLDVFGYRGNREYAHYMQDPYPSSARAEEGDACLCGSGERFEECCMRLIRK